MVWRKLKFFLIKDQAFLIVEKLQIADWVDIQPNLAQNVLKRS